MLKQFVVLRLLIVPCLCDSQEIDVAKTSVITSLFDNDNTTDTLYYRFSKNDTSGPLYQCRLVRNGKQDFLFDIGVSTRSLHINECGKGCIETYQWITGAQGYEEYNTYKYDKKYDNWIFVQQRVVSSNGRSEITNAETLTGINGTVYAKSGTRKIHTYSDDQHILKPGKTLIADISNDAKKDTIIHNDTTNIFTFRYSTANRVKTRQITFFKNFNGHSVHMYTRIEKKMLRFDLYFAPRFMHKDILWFKYDQQKDDWYLTAVTTHRDDPLPLLITDCGFITPKRKISLRSNYYDLVQDYTDPDAKYSLKKKCRSYTDQ